MKKLLLLGSCLLLATCSGNGAIVEKEDVDAGSDLEVVNADSQVDQPTVIPPCGDGLCEDDKGETCATCEEDCGGPCCGNGKCDVELGETCSECPEDCEACKPVCGDGVCDPDHPEFPETCDDCPEDCDVCPTVCGDGDMEGDEECDDGNTDPDDGCDEECKLETDCPNGTCEEGENCENCPDDCPEDCCGDGECDETLGETCETCPDDCCEPGCGDGIVQAEDGEQCDDGNLDPDDGCDEECKLEPVPAEEGDLLITEIMKDPVEVSDTYGEWFELYNTTEYEVDITGWMIVDDGVDDHTIFAEGGVVVPGESYFVLGRSGDEEINGGVSVDYVYGGVEGETFNLGNNDDEIILKSGSDVIDEVWYDSGDLFPDVAGRSLSLSPDAFDAEGNNDGANWCAAVDAYGSGDFGTPGATNPSCEAVPTCPDGECNGDEDCLTCPEDCDPCPTCPDDVCADDETCESCPEDCDPCPYCGDDECNGPETCADCPEDCTEDCPPCPNGECGDDETCETCPDDCGPCPVCPDGECNGEEDCLTCEADCGPCCPNGTCEFYETCLSCPEDCTEGCPCPNGVCDNGETCDTCPADCPCPTCPNQACDNGETCETCPADCGACPCPNGACDNGETCLTCPADCGACTCPNGACDNGETCETCPADCDPCPAEWCKLSGNQGEEVNCALDLAAENAASPKATGAEFIIEFDATKVTFTKFHDEDCDLVPGMCLDWDIPPQGTLAATKHTVASQEQSPGKLKTVIYHAAEPATAITPAYLSGGSVVGDSSMVELVFTLNQTISAGQGVQVELTGLKATDADAGPLSMTFDEGLLVTSADGVPDPVCPDGECNGNETCATCPADCDVCPPVCPDGDCNGNETCTSCPADCGQCPPVCPDGDCTGNETCTTCPADCGACPECGDGDCNGAETCTSCEDDCGACPSGWCGLFGSQGTEVSCSMELAAENVSSPKATGAELVFHFDSTKVTFVKFHGENCDLVPGMCFDWDIPPQGTLAATGHTLTSNEQAPGKIKTLIYHASQPTKPITEAYMSGASVVGDATLVDLVFSMNQTVSAGQPVQVTFTDMMATDAEANSLAMTLQDGVLVTSTQ